MKPCKVFVLDTLFKQAPWPGALDLHFMLHWLCQYFASSLENLRRVQKRSSFLCSSGSCEDGTLHSNCPWHTLHAGTLTWCPSSSFHAPLTLSNFCFESRNKVHFSATVVAVGMKDCIVIVLDTFFKHTSWTGSPDLHFTLPWLCQNLCRV